MRGHKLKTAAGLRFKRKGTKMLIGFYNYTVVLTSDWRPRCSA